MIQAPCQLSNIHARCRRMHGPGIAHYSIPKYSRLLQHNHTRQIPSELTQCEWRGFVRAFRGVATHFYRQIAMDARICSIFRRPLPSCGCVLRIDASRTSASLYERVAVRARRCTSASLQGLAARHTNHSGKALAKRDAYSRGSLHEIPL